MCLETETHIICCNKSCVFHTKNIFSKANVMLILVYIKVLIQFSITLMTINIDILADLTNFKCNFIYI